MNAIHWLVLIIILLVIEIVTLGLTTIWFAGGAVAGFILCLAGAGWKVQSVGFIIVSFLLLIFTRPYAVRHLNSRTQKTNVDSLVGVTALVTEPIDNQKGTGSVVIGGQTWTARSSKDDMVIEAEETVVVERIAGVKAIVRRA